MRAALLCLFALAGLRSASAQTYIWGGKPSTGGLPYTVHSCAADCVATANDGLILVDTSTMDVNVTLPTTSTLGRRLTVKWTSAMGASTYLTGCIAIPPTITDYPQVFILSAASVDGQVIGTDPSRPVCRSHR